MNARELKVKYPEQEEEILSEGIVEELEKISNDTFTNAETSRTVKNIRKTLMRSFKKNYNIKDKEELKNITDEFLKIHGMHESDLDFVKRFETFVEGRINDNSIDDNSNKNEKNMNSVLNETTKSANKIIGFDMLYRTMRDLYGKTEAKRLSEEMYDYRLGLSDSSSILLPYCWAMDASKIVTVGREFGILPSKPARSVGSYTGALCETIHQMSNHLAGAIAIGTFFLDIAHILIYKQRVSFDNVCKDKETRKYIENEYQKFIHSVNHLSRNGAESPFTNVSIFDRDKIMALISEENYEWYFPNKAAVFCDNNEIDEDDKSKYTKEEYKEFIYQYIMELQKIFINFFDAGDPSQDGLQYRFPVTTVNISKHTDENGNYYVDKDNEVMNFIVKKDVSKYNIFSSEGTKIASCCRLINNTEMMDMASTVNSFGGTSVSMGSHRVVTTNFNRIALEAESKEEYFKLLRKRVDSSAKILKAHKLLIMKMVDLGLHMFVSKGWINMNRMFSTFGVLGVVEAQETFKAKGIIENDEDFIGEILVEFEKLTKEIGKEYELLGNIEQIPAESFAVRLAKSDKMIFSEVQVPFKMYANQFVPLWEDKSLWDKLEADGKYNQLLSGGGIVHAQIDENVTATQAKKIINYSVEAGCEHFALNSVYSKCKECGFVTKGKQEKCMKCEGENSFFTRVVGFFTPVESWNPTRRDWEFQRRTFVNLDK